MRAVTTVPSGGAPASSPRKNDCDQDGTPYYCGSLPLEISMRIAPTLAVTAFLTSALAACAANAPSSFSDADRAAIRAAVDSFTTAIKNGDFAAAASYYAENGVFMPPNAPAIM